MASKADQVADVLEREAAKMAPGARLRSVQLLMDELGVSIGTVIAGVDEAIRRGVPLERRRGPDGGYFKANDSQPINTDRSSGHAERPLSVASALVQAQRLRAQMDVLIATLKASAS